MTTRLDNTQVPKNDNSTSRLKSFLEGEKVRNLALSFHSNTERRQVNVGFNVFALVSDVYHKENLHSDVLAAILDPSGAHNRGDQFLQLFLQFLCEHYRVGINLASFRAARVVRESGRIDLLIFDETTREAIIIENKINGAGDMERQAIRYLEDVEDKRGYKCAAIVYLTLNHRGFPNCRGWQPSEIQRVTPLLVPVPAFDDSPHDLCSGWLARCVMEPSLQDDGVCHVLQQYCQILLKMGQNAINQPLMETFWSMLQEPDCHEQVSALATMWSDLPAYRSLRLFERFRGKHSPFLAVSLYRPTLLMFEGLPLKNGERIKIHIDTASPQLSSMVFWDNADDNATLPSAILQDLRMMEQFPQRNGAGFVHTYAFPAEDDALGDDLESILQKLREYVVDEQTRGLS